MRQRSLYVPASVAALAWVILAFVSAVPALAQNVQAVAWGYSGFNLQQVPILPPGLSYTAVSPGNFHSIALRSDGNVVAWGNPGSNVLVVPALPAGLSYTAISAGSTHNLALRSDGTMVAWGSNTQGQCNVPALPANVRYIAIDAGYQHSLAIRSNGTLVAWGSNSQGQCTVPALPAGVTYTSAAGGEAFSVALRSDGTLVAFGSNSQGQRNVPLPPSGVSFIAVAAGGNHALALRSDGTIAAWGSNGYQQTVVPQLPTNVHFTGVAAGQFHSIALRSDGNISAWGQNYYGQLDVPQLPPGSNYTFAAAGHLQSMALLNVGLPAGSAFTFNGHLLSAGTPLNGAADLSFTLWDAPISGGQKGPQVDLAATSIVDGLFSVLVDFGAPAFDGGARWVQLAVRGPGESDYTTLLPRQALTPTPYASYATRAATADVAVSAQIAASAANADSIAWNSIVGIPPALIDGGPWTVTATGDLSVMDRSVAIGFNAPGNGFKLDVNGNIRCVGVTQTSTGLFKRDVQPFGDAMALVRALRPVRYIWNDLAPADVIGRPDIGFVAEDVDRVLPEIVAHDAQGRALGLDYSRLAAVSIQALKQQQVTIDDQAKAMDALRKQNAELAARLAQIEAAISKLNAKSGESK